MIIKGWYFAPKNNRLSFGDNREIVIGETHTISTIEKKLCICEWGLHASSKIIDALEYATGPFIYMVELSGDILHSPDKMAATRRKYIYGLDGSELLRDFAIKIALDSRYASMEHPWDAARFCANRYSRESQNNILEQMVMDKIK